MKIAFLGWGSLVWNPRELKCEGSWKKDGPILPIEFSRISGGQRLTLVLHPGADPVPVLWIIAAHTKVNSAIRNLACREDTNVGNIGYVVIKNENDSRSRIDAVKFTITTWAKERGLDAVVWTDLASNFRELRHVDFTPENAINYLKELKKDDLSEAEAYIRYAPNQISTSARIEIEKALAWKCMDDDYRKRKWLGLRKNFEDEKRIVRKAVDDSFWIVVPDKPATFGHLIILSWKGIFEQDISDKGLITDEMHFQRVMQAINKISSVMRQSLTSDGTSNGRKM